jgi:myo-inositol-1(or 4)-monophosphatase
MELIQAMLSSSFDPGTAARSIVRAEMRGMDLRYELEIAKSLALRAGEKLRQFHKERLVIGRIRDSRDIVTVPDLVVDDIIVSGLTKAFPHDALTSEQSPLSWERFECDRLWLVDAVDGISSLAERGDEYTVSIGLAIRGQAVLGVVYNPIREELFTGSASQPIMVNDAPPRPNASDCRSMPARISIPRAEWGCMVESVPDLRPLSNSCSTSYELARVASGMNDAFFSVLPPREWSTCAGVALVEAGGGFASLRGMYTVQFNNEDLTLPTGLIAARTHPQKMLIENILDLPAVTAVCEELKRRTMKAS